MKASVTPATSDGPSGSKAGDVVGSKSGDISSAPGGDGGKEEDQGAAGWDVAVDLTRLSRLQPGSGAGARAKGRPRVYAPRFPKVSARGRRETVRKPGQGAGVPCARVFYVTLCSAGMQRRRG